MVKFINCTNELNTSKEPIMNLKSCLITLFSFGLISCNGNRAPIYIEPYYNSEPFKINVGAYSEELKNADKNNILEVADKIKANVDNVNIHTLFVLATRLYDLKKKDEAVFWYYTASLRRNVFKRTAIDNRHGTPSGEIAQALDAYKKLLGVYVNGYALGDVDKNIEICKAVIAENKNMKPLDKAYPNLKFDDSKFAEAVAEAVEDRVGFIAYMLKNREMIKEQRTENGMDNKY